MDSPTKVDFKGGELKTAVLYPIFLKKVKSLKTKLQNYHIVVLNIIDSYMFLVGGMYQI